jgi:hypothetical protein
MNRFLKAVNYTPWLVGGQEFPEQGTRQEQLFFLIRYAVLAPSSHNAQPWRFFVYPDRIEVGVERSRALPIADPDDKLLRLALGAANQVLRTNAGATDTEWATISGGTPGGSDTYVQFNDAGAFGGDANLLWNKVTQLLSALVRFKAAQFELAMKTDSASSGTLNNYSLGGRYGILLFTNAAAITLNGIVAPSPGTGQILVVCATGAGGIIFTDEAAGSTAANRLRIGAGTGAAVSVAVPLFYNTDESRWRQAAYVNY